MTQRSRFLTAPQVARLFEVSVQTIRDWAHDGKIPSHRQPSGRLVFVRTEIEPLVPAPKLDAEVA